VNDPRFLEYLQQELGISETEIALANREQQPSVTELPIVLWNYGLIDIEKVEKIFEVDRESSSVAQELGFDSLKVGRIEDFLELMA
jgi:hypothetical protein